MFKTDIELIVELVSGWYVGVRKCFRKMALIGAVEGVVVTLSLCWFIVCVMVGLCRKFHLEKCQNY